MTIRDEVNIGLIKKKMTQVKLAEQMGISRGYLNDILNGSRKPINRLREIEEILDIDLRITQEV